MKKILITLGLFVSIALSAQQTYYVKNGGDDLADGLSDANAWETLAKVKSFSFSSGDSVLFKRGDRWREGEWFLPVSRLTIDAYGLGSEFYEFYGGTKMNAGWIDQGGNVWRYAIIHPIADVGDDGGYSFMFNGDTIRGVYAPNPTDTATLTREFQYARIGTSPNHEIYIYCPQDPDIRYDSIVEDSISRLFRLNNQDSITINNFRAINYKSFPVREEYNTMTIQKYGFWSETFDIWDCGMPNSVFSGGFSVYRNNVVIKNGKIGRVGRRGISMNVDATGTIDVHNVLIDRVFFKYGFHTTGADFSSDGNSSFRNITVSNCIFDDTGFDYDLYGDGSEQLYTESRLNGHIRNFYVYNSEFRYTTGSCINLNDVDTSGIYYNSFFGINPNNPNQVGYQFFVTDGSTEVDARNNVWYNDRNTAISNYGCVYINAASGVDIQTLDYKHYYLEESSNYVAFEQGGGGTYTQDQFGTWQLESGYDANSTAAENPDFTSIIEPYNLRPVADTSPLVGAGTPIAMVTTDRDGNLRSLTAPTIGAYEFQEVDSAYTYLASFFIPLQVSTVIDTLNRTVAVTMPYNTDRSALTPVYTVSNGTGSPLSGTRQDFSSPFDYTLTALNGVNTFIYTVTVTNQPAPPEPGTKSGVINTRPLVINGRTLTF